MPTTVNQPQFAQDRPLAFCRSAYHNLHLCRELVTAGKINYIFKCRRARCSRECNRAWANKHSAIVHKLLRDYLPDGSIGMVVRKVLVYRGHLRMPPDASPTDHKRAKKEFLRIMRRWARRGNRRKLTCADADYTFEVHATQHITDPRNCHWDCVAYSDAPTKTLRAAVSDAWERAGGLRQSLVPLDPDEIEAQSKYQSKDVKPETRRGTHYMPAAGLQCHWSTAGFWQDHKPDDLWREVIAEWLADKAASNERDTLLEPTTTTETTTETSPESPHKAALRSASPWLEDGSKSVSLSLDDSPDEVAERARVIAGIDRRLDALPRRDRENVRAVLPESPEHAVLPERIANDVGLMVDDVSTILGSKPFGVRSRSRPRGRFADDVWYLDMPPMPEARA